MQVPAPKYQVCSKDECRKVLTCDDVLPALVHCIPVARRLLPAVCVALPTLGCSRTSPHQYSCGCSTSKTLSGPGHKPGRGKSGRAMSETARARIDSGRARPESGQVSQIVQHRGCSQPKGTDRRPLAALGSMGWQPAQMLGGVWTNRRQKVAIPPLRCLPTRPKVEARLKI